MNMRYDTRRVVVKECVSTVILCIVIVYILPGKFMLGRKNSGIDAASYVGACNCTCNRQLNVKDCSFH